MNKHWLTPMCQALNLSPVKASACRVAIVGVGHALRGDDAAGSVVARQLGGAAAPDRVLVVDGGCAPENHLGRIVRFRPDVVIFVDVAELGLPPGEVRWLSAEAIGETMTSTHTMSLALSARFLQHETNCAVFLLGIQPLSDGFEEGMSPPVAAAVDHVVDALRQELLA